MGEDDIHEAEDRRSVLEEDDAASRVGREEGDDDERDRKQWGDGGTKIWPRRTTGGISPSANFAKLLQKS